MSKVYYVITDTAGELMAIFLSSPYGIAIPNSSIHEMDGEVPDLNVKQWDSATDDFIDRSDLVTKLQFINRFTLQERVGMRTSADPVVLDIIETINLVTYVNVRDPITIQGVHYLAYVGLLAPERVPAILA